MLTNTNSKGNEMTRQRNIYSGSRKCTICGCSVMVRSHKTLKRSLMAAVAMADHAKAHGVR